MTDDVSLEGKNAQALGRTTQEIARQNGASAGKPLSAVMATAATAREVARAADGQQGDRRDD